MSKSSMKTGAGITQILKSEGVTENALQYFIDRIGGCDGKKFGKEEKKLLETTYEDFVNDCMKEKEVKFELPQSRIDEIFSGNLKRETMRPEIENIKAVTNFIKSTIKIAANSTISMMSSKEDKEGYVFFAMAFVNYIADRKSLLTEACARKDHKMMDGKKISQEGLQRPTLNIKDLSRKAVPDIIGEAQSERNALVLEGLLQVVDEGLKRVEDGLLTQNLEERLKQLRSSPSDAVTSSSVSSAANGKGSRRK